MDVDELLAPKLSYMSCKVVVASFIGMLKIRNRVNAFKSLKKRVLSLFEVSHDPEHVFMISKCPIFTL